MLAAIFTWASPMSTAHGYRTWMGTALTFKYAGVAFAARGSSGGSGAAGFPGLIALITLPIFCNFLY